MNALETMLTIKAVVAGLAVVLLVAHMWLERTGVGSVGRTMRYIALLACACAFAYAGVDQLQQAGFVFRGRNTLGFAASVLVFAAAFVSLLETWNTRRRT